MPRKKGSRGNNGQQKLSKQQKKELRSMKAAQGQQQCLKDTAVAHIQSASTAAVLPAALSTALFGDDSPVQQCDAADRFCTECKVLFKDADALADHTIMEHATYAGSVQQHCAESVLILVVCSSPGTETTTRDYTKCVRCSHSA
jgi:hypothetical protein